MSYKGEWIKVGEDRWLDQHTGRVLTYAQMVKQMKKITSHLSGASKRNSGKRNSKSAYGKTYTAKTIDVDAIYQKMKAAIARRNELQSMMDNLWKEIQRTHSNHRQEMADIRNRIGQATHTINGYISELCKYKKTHKAMNMAYNYIQGEIERTDKIICKWENTIRNVEFGITTLINDKGQVHTNTANSREYLGKKMRYREQLIRWLEYVSHYRV